MFHYSLLSIVPLILIPSLFSFPRCYGYLFMCSPDFVGFCMHIVHHRYEYLSSIEPCRMRYDVWCSEFQAQKACQIHEAAKQRKRDSKLLVNRLRWGFWTPINGFIRYRLVASAGTRKAIHYVVFLSHFRIFGSSHIRIWTFFIWSPTLSRKVDAIYQCVII